ncbi:MAG: hypothetical protein M1481_03655 [Candidatus Thermoplasmatota archaeon]|nr:hypothetical protein [Candidatus Thermoplasmatota archaeon]MCL5963391.1 hypothetical protein [Candidatus Thermoplasmatota archaeon]
MEWGKTIVLLIAILTPLILIPYEWLKGGGNVLVIFASIVVFFTFSSYYTTYHK